MPVTVRTPVDRDELVKRLQNVLEMLQDPKYKPENIAWRIAYDTMVKDLVERLKTGEPTRIDLLDLIKW